MKNSNLFLVFPRWLARSMTVTDKIQSNLNNFKFFYQRGMKGYSQLDIENFEKYLTYILAYGGAEAAKWDHQYPYSLVGDFDSDNEAREYWGIYVKEMAQHFYNSLKSNQKEVKPNRYHTIYNMLMTRGKLTHPLIAKYWDEEEKIREWQEEEKIKGMQMLYSMMTARK